MKTLRKESLLLTLLLCLSLLFCACTTANPAAPAAPEQQVETPQGETAVYTEDTELGEGAKTLTFKVADAENKTITFTIHTDAETVGAALLEQRLIAGDESEIGLYVKVVNGVRADYDADGAYWSFTQNGEYMATGVDATPLTDGAQYEFVYTKG